MVKFKNTVTSKEALRVKHNIKCEIKDLKKK